VLFVLIPAVCFAVVLFGFAMFRLAARSDDSQAAAMAEWLARRRLPAEPPAPAAEPDEQRRPDRQRGAYRATG
jgi:hypothetical protein